jgi:hypothetical protein
MSTDNSNKGCIVTVTVKVEGCCVPPQQPPIESPPIELQSHLDFIIGPVSSRFPLHYMPEVERKAMFMSNLILTDSQKVMLTLAPVTAAGNPAPVDGVPTWGSSDETILTVTPAADGMSCEAFTTGLLGTAQINVTADVEMDEGITNLTGAQIIDVLAGQAVSLGIQAGTPEEK